LWFYFRDHILKECCAKVFLAKYFSLKIYTTPDFAHIGQTEFLIRYVHQTCADESKQEEPELVDPYKVQNVC